MFPAAEYVTAGELAYRRERIANDFARVGRVRKAPRRRRHRFHRPTVRLHRVRHAVR
jgi:hypothetical protein